MVRINTLCFTVCLLITFKRTFQETYVIKLEVKEIPPVDYRPEENQQDYRRAQEHETYQYPPPRNEQFNNYEKNSLSTLNNADISSEIKWDSHNKRPQPAHSTYPHPPQTTENVFQNPSLENIRSQYDNIPQSGNHDNERQPGYEINTGSKLRNPHKNRSENHDQAPYDTTHPNSNIVHSHSGYSPENNHNYHERIPQTSQVPYQDPNPKIRLPQHRPQTNYEDINSRKPITDNHDNVYNKSLDITKLTYQPNIPQQNEYSQRPAYNVHKLDQVVEKDNSTEQNWSGSKQAESGGVTDSPIVNNVNNTSEEPKMNATVSFPNRAAFDGDVCPKDQVRVKGKCVQPDKR